MTTIFEALSAVMEDVRAVGKNDRNTAPNGNYKFRGIDAVTNAVGPALRKHGVIVAPTVLDWQYGTVTVGAKQTQMSHARLLIKFTWYGPDGETTIETVAAGEAFDSGDKATAKAHSVAFRTAMIQTLCLPTDEPDPDEHTYVRSTVTVESLRETAQIASSKPELVAVWHDAANAGLLDAACGNGETLRETLTRLGKDVATTVGAA